MGDEHSTAPRKRLRLAKVELVAHFVVDDGENLGDEIVGQVVVVSGADWHGYPARLEEDRVAQENLVNAEPEPVAG